MKTLLYIVAAIVVVTIGVILWMHHRALKAVVAAKASLAPSPSPPPLADQTQNTGIGNNGNGDGGASASNITDSYVPDLTGLSAEDLGVYASDSANAGGDMEQATGFSLDATDAVAPWGLNY